MRRIESAVALLLLMPAAAVSARRDGRPFAGIANCQAAASQSDPKV